MNLWPKLSAPANVAAWSIAFIAAYVLHNQYQTSTNVKTFDEAEKAKWNNDVKKREQETKDKTLKQSTN